MRNKTCLLEDQALFHKFCKSLEAQIGCKTSHGTSSDFPGQCVACPLALAEAAPAAAPAATWTSSKAKWPRRPWTLREEYLAKTEQRKTT